MKTIKLKELTQQSCSTIERLNEGDFSGLDNLQATLDQINQAIGSLVDVPVTWLDQAKESTSEALGTLQKIMSQADDNTSELVQSLSKEIHELTDFIEQGSRNEDEQAEAATAESESSESHDEGFTILADDLELIVDFINESSEHLEAVEGGLLKLEEKPDDAETLNTIFRAFHTIKGMAGFLNLVEIGSLAHAAENLLDLARKNELVLAAGKCDIIFASVDALKTMIDALRASANSGQPVPKFKGLQEILDGLKASETESDAQEQPPAPVTNPSEMPEKPADTIPIDVIETKLVQNADQKLDTLLKKERPSASSEVSYIKAKTALSDEKIKVSTTRLDNLINMAGELAVSHLMVTEEINTNVAVNHTLNRKVGHHSKIVRELQELTMSMRMVPIQGVFQKMSRLVRDLSRKMDKQILFKTVGEETELDRSIVDKIADPLVHMVRNSADHGIESAQVRVDAGKPAAGTIELRAFHQAGNIVIEIADDGKGLDKEVLLEKALQRGLIQPNQELSDEEVFKLIFHAGFSTAQKVTNVSGRGVGMDVVRKNIEALRGKVDISSELGKGSTFTIRLPLTLSLIDGQVVMVGCDRYIIPVNSIVRSYKPTAEQMSSILNRGEIALTQGKLVPVISLHELFGMTQTSKGITESLLVTVEEDQHQCCLVVDDLLGQQQVVIKTLGEMMGSIKGVSGGAIMGDGKVSLILDIPSLMEMARS